MAAAGTLVGVDHMRLAQVAHNSMTGTIALACSTSLALVGIDLVGHHREEPLASNLVDVVMQHGIHRQLLGERTPMLGIVHKLMGREVHILQTLKQLAANDVCHDNVLNVLRMNLHIGCVIGHNPHDGALGTKAEASCSHNIDTASQALLTN